MLIFMDESAANEKTGDRKRGWSPIGLPAVTTRSLHRSKRWSILPAFTTAGYIAWEIHQGSITREIFNDFIAGQVLPQCGSYSLREPFSVLIMDNAVIHHSEVSAYTVRKPDTDCS